MKVTWEVMLNAKIISYLFPLIEKHNYYVLYNHKRYKIENEYNLCDKMSKKIFLINLEVLDYMKKSLLVSFRSN